jgi:hypothetical protein
MHTKLRFRFWLVLVVVLASCRLLTPSEPQPVATLTPSLAASATLPPLPTGTAVPSPSPAPTLSPTAVPEAEPGFIVRLHPDGGLFVGDLVSIEVIAPPGANLEGAQVSIQVDDPDGPLLGPVDFGRFGIQGRAQATLIWGWDTAGLEAGLYVLTFSIQPDGPAWDELVILNPAEAVPPPEPEAAWASVETECCIIHYVTGTAAERDLAELVEAADRQAELAVQRLGGEFTEPLVVTLLPRVLGHGGFASNEISVSYLDQNYAGSQFEMVLHHEMIHVLDMRLGGQLRPSMLVEGLAVYLSGGHFKPEAIMPRTAALLALPPDDEGSDLGWYLSLQPLADDFYASQHEIGYLQAAALVEYMISTWGWQAFSDFYRDILPDDSGSQALAIDGALRRHFQITLAGLEEQFLQTLRQVEVTQDDIEDIRLTVTYYDTVRRYQRLLDTSAYFRTAWLLSNEEMRQRGIVADYVRHPQAPANVCLESLLVTANQHLQGERHDEASLFLETVNAALDNLEESETESVPGLPVFALSVHPVCAVWAGQ